MSKYLFKLSLVFVAAGLLYVMLLSDQLPGFVMGILFITAVWLGDKHYG